MAGTSKANLRQTSANVAATLTAAFASSGLVDNKETALGLFQDIRDEVFTDLAKQPTEASGGYQKRSSGGSKQGGNSDPGSVVMNYGKFKGLTIEQVYGMDAAATSEYGYDKTGKQYITWLTKNDSNKFLQDKAKAFIESKRSSAASAPIPSDPKGVKPEEADQEDW